MTQKWHGEGVGCSCCSAGCIHPVSGVVHYVHSYTPLAIGGMYTLYTPSWGGCYELVISPGVMSRSEVKGTRLWTSPVGRVGGRGSRWGRSPCPMARGACVCNRVYEAGWRAVGPIVRGPRGCVMWSSRLPCNRTRTGKCIGKCFVVVTITPTDLEQGNLWS